MKRITHANDVYILLRDEDDSIEKQYIGTLYLVLADDGSIIEIAIEPFSSEDRYNSSLYLDWCDSEVPEVPGHVRIEAKRAFCASLEDPSEGEWIDLEDESASSGMADRGKEAYARIVYAALRIYERVIRGEPILVGYKDIDRHNQFCSDRRLRPALRLVLPPKRKRGPSLRETVKNSAGYKNVSRVTLKPEEGKSTKWLPTLVIDLVLQSDSFPARLGYFAGIALDKNANLCGLIVEECGTVSLRIPGFMRAPLVTNLMSCAIIPDSQLLFWTNYYQSRFPYRVSNIVTLVESV